jgi:uncharacterized membrane protein YeaQ/YmgE (transglycosylase-associated protein family)
MGILLSVLIGLLAGYFGSVIFKGSGSGILINLIVGVIGGFIGGGLFDWLGVEGGNIIWQLISATVGAIILLWVVSLIKRV